MAYNQLDNNRFVDSTTGIVYEYRHGIGMVAVTDASGATIVSDTANPSGLLQTWFIDVEPATAPTLAGSGYIAFTLPVRNPTITSVTLTAADVISLAAQNWTIRVAIDPANEAAALLSLPTTFPTGSPDPVVGQVWSFNLKPIMLSDTEAAGDLRVWQIVLDTAIEIPTSSAISTLAFAHNLNAGMTLVFGVSAVREV